MIYKAIINDDVEYMLAEFNPLVFSNQMVLDLVTDDLHEVK